MDHDLINLLSFFLNIFIRFAYANIPFDFRTGLKIFVDMGNYTNHLLADWTRASHEIIV